MHTIVTKFKGFVKSDKILAGNAAKCRFNLYVGMQNNILLKDKNKGRIMQC